MRKQLTVAEAADLLNIDQQTLYRMNYRRTGPPARKVGKYLRYDPDELETWLKSRTTANPAA
jgi:excisionase family DNA binding protein